MTRLILLLLVTAVFALNACTTSPPPSADAGKKKVEGLVYPEPPLEPRFYFERTLRSSADIEPEDDTSAFRRAFTGEKRKGDGLAKPYGVAVRHGRVFVTDTARRAVVVFDIPGKKFYQIGLEEDEDGHGKLGQPIGVDLDGEGNVYVLDARAKQVMVYTPEGKFLRSFGDNTMLYKPAGIGVNQDGSRVYAVDIGGSSSDEHKIVVFDGKTGQKLSNISKRGTSDGEVNLPRDVVVAKDGSLYVVDGGNFRIQKLDKEGKFITKWGAVGRQSGQFSRPKEAAIDPEGNIYVIDTAFGNFQIFTGEGQLLLAIGGRSNTDGPGLYMLPAGIAVDDDGRVYVVDQYFRKVDVFRPAALAEDGGWIGKFAPKKKDSSDTSTSQPASPSTTEPAKKTAPSAQPVQSDTPAAEVK